MCREHRPRKRLKSHVAESICSGRIPSTTRSSGLRVDRDRDRRLEAIERVVREERQVIT